MGVTAKELQAAKAIAKYIMDNSEFTPSFTASLDQSAKEAADKAVSMDVDPAVAAVIALGVINAINDDALNLTEKGVADELDMEDTEALLWMATKGLAMMRVMFTIANWVHNLPDKSD